MNRFLAAACLVALPLGAALPTQEEALALAYPGASLTRKDYDLTPDQASRAKALAARDLQGGHALAFEAWKDGKLLGVAWLESHRVRTQNEAVVVALDGKGAILRVEVVAFHEPQEYLARPAWVRQFAGRRLDADLALGRGIKPLAGATLTAGALTDAARRGLALWQVLYGAAR